MNIGIFTGSPSAGARDGSLVSDVNPVRPGAMIADGGERIGAPVKLAVRALNTDHFRDGTFQVALTGATSQAWALAPDAGGAPGAWGAWGESLTLAGPVTDTNTLFWVRARAMAGEVVTGLTDDLSVALQVPDEVMVRVARSLAASWTMRAAVSRALAQVYAILAPVGASLAQPFTVASFAVGRSLGLPSSIAAAVGRSLTLPSTITAAVGRAAALPFSILSPVGRSLGLAYALGVTAWDTFTDTPGDSLTAAHTSDSAHPWVSHPTNASNPAIISDANRLRSGGASGYWKYTIAAALADADYMVRVVIRVKSINGAAFHTAGCIGRAHATAETMYYVTLTESSGGDEIRLWKIVTGVFTQLGPTISPTALVDESEHTLDLEMIGTAIKVYYDGVEIIGVTDAAIAAAGSGGVFLQDGAEASSDTVGLHVDSMTITG